MTVVPRRRTSRLAKRKGPAPLAQRFPRGRRVQVYDDFHDARYAGRYGTVVEVTSAGGDPHYPLGRVAVRLVVDDLYASAFGGRAPNPVWFKPADLDRHPETYQEHPRGEF